MRSITYLIILALFLSGCGLMNDVTISNAFADMKIYRSLAELEADSGVIAIVAPTGKWEPHHYYDSSGQIRVLTLTKTEVEFKLIYKGDVAEGTITNIYEPAYWDDKLFVTTDGYNLMKEGRTYLMFLKTASDAREFMPTGVYQGKFEIGTPFISDRNIKSAPDSKRLKYEFFGENVDHFNELKKVVFEKYTIDERKMSNIDIAFVIYLFMFLVISTAIYISVSKLIEKTKNFASFVVVSLITNIVFGFLIIIGWVLYVWNTNEIILFLGVTVGIVASSITTMFLLLVLIFNKKKLKGNQV